jgi:hypothetical protein
MATFTATRSFGDIDLPPLDLGGRGGDSGWVELLRAPDDIEAHLIGGRLETAGIEVSMLKDRSGPAWLFGGSNPWAPVTLLVRKLQLDDARIVLAEVAFEAPAIPVAAARPRGWRGPVAFWAAAIALGTLFTGLALARTEDALRNCDLPLVCSEGAGGER